MKFSIFQGKRRYQFFFLEKLPVDPKHVRSGLQKGTLFLDFGVFRIFSRCVRYVLGRQKQPFLCDFLFMDDTPLSMKIAPPPPECGREVCSKIQIFQVYGGF